MPMSAIPFPFFLSEHLEDPSLITATSLRLPQDALTLPLAFQGAVERRDGAVHVG
jgi:hypothetical protein